jgi:hypothetical protein
MGGAFKSRLSLSCPANHQVCSTPGGSDCLLEATHVGWPLVNWQLSAKARRCWTHDQQEHPYLAVSASSRSSCFRPRLLKVASVATPGRCLAALAWLGRCLKQQTNTILAALRVRQAPGFMARPRRDRITITPPARVRRLSFGLNRGAASGAAVRALAASQRIRP